MPLVARKDGLQVVSLSEQAILLVQGVLSASEAKAVVAAAERIGFEHQGSRGPAHGEVLHSLTLLPPGITALWELDITTWA